MSVVHQELILKSREGNPLRTDIRYVSTHRPKPIVLFIHGFKGFKDWGAFPLIRDRLANEGYVVIAFNFSHNGIGNDLQNFTELDRFAEQTISRELGEVKDILSMTRKGELAIDQDEIDTNSISILAHSRGAGTAMLAVSEDMDIQNLILWAPISSFNRFSDRQNAEWRKTGFIEQLNSRTNQLMRINSALLDDLEDNKEKFDIPRIAKELSASNIPLHIIVGSEDISTPIAESNAIAKAYGEKVRLTIIEKTGHTFGAVHPFEDSSDALEQLITQTITYLKNDQ